MKPLNTIFFGEESFTNTTVTKIYFDQRLPYTVEHEKTHHERSDRCNYEQFLYRTLLQVILQDTLKRLPHRILSLESTTNPAGAGDA